MEYPEFSSRPQDYIEYAEWAKARIEALEKALAHIQRMSTVPIITDIAETALQEAEK